MKIKIERLGINGEGIASLNDGKIGFVEYALPGEVIEGTIYQNKAKFCRVKLESVEKPSKHRVAAPCPYFGVCGGCDVQHMCFSYQLEFKKLKVQDCLKKIAKIDFDIKEIISANSYNYRNKVVFPVRFQDGKTVIGLFKKQSHQVVEIENCLIADNKIVEAFKIIKNYLLNSNLVGFNEKTLKGDVKYFVLRHISNQILLTLVCTRKINFDNLYAILKSNFDSVGLSIVSDNKDIMSGKYVHIAGIEAIELEEFGIKYSIDNRGFLQVNNEIKTLLYKSVLEQIENNDIVIDAYSGAGLMSAIISKKCKTVSAIEINKSACESAKNLVERNNINNLTIYCADVKEKLGECIEKTSNPVVILDPPRAGCEKEVLQIIENKAKKIVYISCDPATLARDLSFLKTYYKIDKITLFEMFPQTSHVETLVVLSRL